MAGRSRKSKGLAHYSGYWVPQIDTVRGDSVRQWNDAQVPQRFERGEALPNLQETVGLGHYVTWWYQGQAVRRAAPAVHVLVAQGRARLAPKPAQLLSCSGTAPCPETGIWEARLKRNHAQYAVFHDRWQQVYLQQGRPMPEPSDLHAAGGLNVTSRDIRWHWLGEANEGSGTRSEQVTMTALDAGNR